MNSQEISKYIKKNYLNYSNDDLCRSCGIKKYQLYNILKVNNLSKKPQKHWTADEDRFLIKNWPDKSKKYIMNYLNDRSYKSIKSRVRILKIKKINEFKNLNKLKNLLNNTNESYYWLGFIMADGHFGKDCIKISVSIKDFKILDDFRSFIQVNNKISIFKGKIFNKYKCNNYCSISINDAKTVNVLKNIYNISSNKTKNACDISSLKEKDHVLSWFAGFFDGDGCILKRKEKCCGLRIQCHKSWYNNLEFISNKLKLDCNINSRSYLDTQNYARWVCFKDRNLLYNEFNKLNLPLLDRKNIIL